MWALAEPRVVDLHFDACFSSRKIAKKTIFTAMGFARQAMIEQSSAAGARKLDRPSLPSLDSLPLVHKTALEAEILNGDTGALRWVHRESRWSIFRSALRLTIPVCLLLVPLAFLPVSFLFQKQVSETILVSSIICVGIWILWTFLAALQRNFVSPSAVGLTSGSFVQSFGVSTSCFPPYVDRKDLQKSFPLRLSSWSTSSDTGCIEIAGLDGFHHNIRSAKEENLIAKYNLASARNLDQASSWINATNVRGMKDINQLSWDSFVEDWIRQSALASNYRSTFASTKFDLDV